MKNLIRKSSALVATMLLAKSADLHAAAPADKIPQRQILICVADHESPAIRAAAEELVAHPEAVPVLKAMVDSQGAGPVVLQSSEALLKDYNRAAYNHLLVIGLHDDDALMAKVWEHYISVPAKDAPIYSQGWGYLQGELGYIESDRNPFLHSRKIASAPFETVLWKITGTDEAGVLAAVKAFKGGLLNGIVPAGPFSRPKTTLLDLDPYIDPPALKLPETIVVDGSSQMLTRAGWSQVPKNEYLAYAEIGSAEPVHVWRAKYLAPHALDQAGVAGWLVGFQRIAWGNAVTVSEYRSPDEAAKMAQAIGSRKGFHVEVAAAPFKVWSAPQPAVATRPNQPNEDEILPYPPGQMSCVAIGRFVLLSSLETKANVALLHSLQSSGEEN